MEISDLLKYIIFYLFWFFISTKTLKYVMYVLYFVLPMRKKYNILQDDIKSNTGIYILTLLALSFNILFIILSYVVYIYLLIFLIPIYIFLIKKWKKLYSHYDLLEYINNYSSNLFNWKSIYNLNIDEKLKKECFAIHYINYEEFEKNYIQSLEYEIENNNKKIDYINLKHKDK